MRMFTAKLLLAYTAITSMTCVPGSLLANTIYDINLTVPDTQQYPGTITGTITTLTPVSTTAHVSLNTNDVISWDVFITSGNNTAELTPLNTNVSIRGDVYSLNSNLYVKSDPNALGSQLQFQNLSPFYFSDVGGIAWSSYLAAPYGGPRQVNDVAGYVDSPLGTPKYFVQTVDSGQGAGSLPDILVGSSANSAVPEPSSFALLALGGFGLAVAAMRRRMNVKEPKGVKPNTLFGS